MLRGPVCLAILSVSVSGGAQDLEERLRAQGFILRIDEYEQLSILAKDDSFRFYDAFEWDLEPLRKVLYDTAFDEGDRKAGDEALASNADLMSDLWEVTSKPRYYLDEDWGDIHFRVPHMSTMRSIARIHRLLTIMAAEDGRYEDVLRSLQAMQTLSVHAADLPGLLGASTAQGINAMSRFAIAESGSRLADDEEGLALLIKFVGSLPEWQEMTGLKMEVPMTLAFIDQLASGDLTISNIRRASVGLDSEESDPPEFLRFHKHHAAIRERYLGFVLDFAEAWGDHAAVIKVQAEIDADLEKETNDEATMLSNMALLILLPIYESSHGWDMADWVRTKMIKIGLVAMETHRTSGEWPTLSEAAKTAGVDPSDPFGDLIHYLPSENGLTLYSNGLDMDDDGGKRTGGEGTLRDGPIVIFRVVG
ncbi:MAG: hypothetical protein IH945_11440 [Armatimonadetes bacterium]|nr:hypothetical protein [Armatimonadota bacterium]